MPETHQAANTLYTITDYQFVNARKMPGINAKLTRKPAITRAGWTVGFPSLTNDERLL
jgi:hypothetical protein